GYALDLHSGIIIDPGRTRIVHDHTALGELEDLPYPGHGIGLMPALACDHRPGWIGVFHKMVVVDLPVVQSSANGPAPHSLGGYGILPDEPVGHVDIVDMLFQDMVPTDPIEIIPIAHLVFQFTLLRGARPHPYPVTVPVHLAGNDLAQASPFQQGQGIDIVFLISAL